MRTLVLRLMALIVFALFSFPALADTWNVTRARGQVQMLVDGDWQPLKRGGAVPDERAVQTGATGHLTLVRGQETIELGPNTQIRIFDKEGRKPFTTVQQDFGTVSVEAEVRNVQHFAVRTSYLAAVVKGTRFTVTAGKRGASVSVQRGQVAVEDAHEHSSTLIVAGQKASVAKGQSMAVSGKGKLPPILKKGAKPPKPLKPPAARDADPAGAVDAAVTELEAAKLAGDEKAIAKAEEKLKHAAAEATKAATKALARNDKDAAKAAAEAARAAERAARDQRKAGEEAAKAAAKAAEEARKAADKAAKDAEKATRDSAKSDKNGNGKPDTGTSGDKSSKGSGMDTPKKGKG